MNTSCQLQSFSVRYFPDILLPPCAFTLALSTLPFIPRKALPTLLSYHHHLPFFHFLASPSSFVGFPLFRSCSTTPAVVTHHIMEPQQHYSHHQQLQQQQLQHNEENSGGGSKGSFLCRQTSTRWTPTSDQIRILKELYYKNGIRSPTTEQIQRISARLRQYGKIEGKNVFYWFQNHKARERQKKKFTTDVPMHPRSIPTTTTVANAAAWKPADHHDYSFHCSKNPNISPHPGFSSGPNSSTGGVVTVAQMGSCGYGSVTMERSFRDCSISSAGSNTGVGGSISHYNSGWFGIDPYSASYTSLFGKQKAINQLTKEEEEDEEDEEEDEEEEEESATAGTETLPLFPIQRDDINNAFCNIRQYNPSCSYYSNWPGSYDDHANGGSHASLELSLKSFGTGKSPDSL